MRPAAPHGLCRQPPRSAAPPMDWWHGPISSAARGSNNSHHDGHGHRRPTPAAAQGPIMRRHFRPACLNRSPTGLGEPRAPRRCRLGTLGPPLTFPPLPPPEWAAPNGKWHELWPRRRARPTQPSACRDLGPDWDHVSGELHVASAADFETSSCRRPRQVSHVADDWPGANVDMEF